MENVVCFDIGGTNVKYGLLNTKGNILDKNLFSTNIEDSNDILENMCIVIEKYLSNNKIKGISISSPGVINTKTGIIEEISIIKGFRGLNIKQYFEQKYKLPVAIENDANCATIAEHILGSGAGCENLVCITIGTGIGGGIVINNKIYNGNRSMAGEFGFMFINGSNHSIPENHILSRYASTKALVDRASKGLNEEIDGEEIFERAKNGDAICQKSIDEFYDYLSTGIYNIAYVLSPDKILIGGAISQQENIIDEIKIRLEKFKTSFSDSLNDYIGIDRCKFLNDAGLIGSLSNFISTYN